MLRAKDLMEKNFLTLAPRNTLLWGIKQLRTNRVRYIPVVENKKLVGLVVERDLRDVLPSVVEQSDVEILNQTCIERVMQNKVITITEDTLILEAAKIMNENKIGCLPVVRGQRILGLLTETHVINGLVHLLGSCQEEI